MWNSDKSLQLSRVCTRLVMALVIVCGVGLPYMMGVYENITNYYIADDGVAIFQGLLYGCCVPALVALFSLDKILSNIKKEQVFIPENVRYLRIISWCCFGVAILSAIAGYYYILFIFVAVVAAFIGLILRVVKNVIEQAVCIKAENDFTI